MHKEKIVSLFTLSFLCVSSAVFAKDQKAPMESSPELTASIQTFVSHPTHCYVFLGGDGYVAESVPLNYSEALFQVLKSSNVAWAEVLSRVRQICEAREGIGQPH